MKTANLRCCAPVTNLLICYVILNAYADYCCVYFRRRAARAMLTPTAFAVYSRPNLNWRGHTARFINVRYSGEYSGSSLSEKKSGYDCCRRACRLRAPGSSVSQSSVRRPSGQRHDGSCEKKTSHGPRQLAEQVDSIWISAASPARLKSPAPRFINIFLGTGFSR